MVGTGVRGEWQANHDRSLSREFSLFEAARLLERRAFGIIPRLPPLLDPVLQRPTGNMVERPFATISNMVSCVGVARARRTDSRFGLGSVETSGVVSAAGENVRGCAACLWSP